MTIVFLFSLFCFAFSLSSRSPWPYSPSKWADEHGRSVSQSQVTLYETAHETAAAVRSLARSDNKRQATVTFTVTPTVLASGGVENFTLAWSSVSNPAQTDIIAVFSPPLSDYQNASLPPVILGQIFACEGWSTNEKGASDCGTTPGKKPARVVTPVGAGTFAWPLLNMRDDYQFVYFDVGTVNGYDYLAPVAVSPTIKVNKTVQQYARLARTTAPSEMRVTWTAVTGQAKPMVRWGEQSTKLSSSNPAVARTYTRDDFRACQNDSYAVALYRDPGTQYTAVMKGLTPSTQYYYQVGDAATDSWGPVFTFVSAKAIGPDSGVRFFAIGDLGTALACTEHMIGWCQIGAPNTTAAMIRALQAGGPDSFDMVAHIGDISYATGRENRWEEFGASVEPLSSTIPYMVGSGNHEYDHVSPSAADGAFPKGQPYQPYYSNFGDDSLGDCNIPYTYRFPMPTPHDLNTEESYYSVDVGNVHYVTLSFEQNYEPGSDQYAWLEADLAAVNRSVTPFLVVASHRAMYCSWDGPNDYIMGIYEQRYLEELLVKYRTDLFFAGHYHIYQRSCPVVNQVCDEEKGIVHVVVGNAGMDHHGRFFTGDVPWSEFIDPVNYGYSVIETTRSNLTLSYYESAEGKLMDTVTIKARF